MTKTEVKYRVEQIINAVYEIQDRVKNGESNWLFPGQGIIANIDEHYALRRTNTRFEIINRHDKLKFALGFVSSDKDFISIISSLIEKYLRLCDS